MRSSRPEDSTSRSPEGGGDKGKQRKTDINVEEEQGKLSEERKRKARANEGDDRFSKRSKDEETVESKKFDVSEDELGTEFIQVHVGIEETNWRIQNDSVVRGVGWTTQWPTMWIAEMYDMIVVYLDHVTEMNMVDIAKVCSPS